MRRSRVPKGDTRIKLPADFEQTLKALLQSPPPPKRKAVKNKGKKR